MQVSAILLAAGRGKRMHSTLPKVLHKIANKPLLFYSLKLLSQLPINDIQVVVGYRKDIVKSAALKVGRELKIDKKMGFSVQKKMLGTGDAVRTVLEHVDSQTSEVIVMNGDDSFLYKPTTIEKVLALHNKSQADMTFITLKPKNPRGGRIVRDKSGRVARIVEEKAATKKQLKIKEINDGCYVFKVRWLRKFINEIKLNPAGEYYLTDLVEIGSKNGAKIETYLLPDISEWFGINTKEELKKANELYSLSV